MASKGSYCEMCSKRGKKKDMIFDNGRYFCSKECVAWFKETYGECDYKQNKIVPQLDTMTNQK